MSQSRPGSFDNQEPEPPAFPPENPDLLAEMDPNIDVVEEAEENDEEESREHAESDASTRASTDADEHGAPFDDIELLIATILVGATSMAPGEYRRNYIAQNRTPPAGTIVTATMKDGTKKRLSAKGTWVDEGHVDEAAAVDANLGTAKTKVAPQTAKKLKATAKEEEALSCKVAEDSKVHDTPHTLLGAIFAAFKHWSFYPLWQIGYKVAFAVTNSAVVGPYHTAEFGLYKMLAAVSGKKRAERWNESAQIAYAKAKNEDGLLLAAGNLTVGVVKATANLVSGFATGETPYNSKQSFGEALDCMKVSAPTIALSIVAPRNAIQFAKATYIINSTEKNDPKRDDAEYMRAQIWQDWRGFLPFTAKPEGATGEMYERYAKANAKTDPGAFYYMMSLKKLGPSNMPIREKRITFPTTALSNATLVLNTRLRELAALEAETPVDDKAINKKKKAIIKAQNNVNACQLELRKQAGILAERQNPGIDLSQKTTGQILDAAQIDKKLADAVKERLAESATAQQNAQMKTGFTPLLTVPTETTDSNPSPTQKPGASLGVTPGTGEQGPGMGLGVAERVETRPGIALTTIPVQAQHTAVIAPRASVQLDTARKGQIGSGLIELFKILMAKFNILQAKTRDEQVPLKFETRPVGSMTHVHNAGPTFTIPKSPSPEETPAPLAPSTKGAVPSASTRKPSIDA